MLRNPGYLCGRTAPHFDIHLGKTALPRYKSTTQTLNRKNRMDSDQAANLSAEYGFQLGRRPSIRIDDQTASDRSPPFCNIVVDFVPEEAMVLRFGNLPLDDDVRSSLKRLKATVQESATGTQVEFTLPITSAHQLRLLATLVRRV